MSLLSNAVSQDCCLGNDTYSLFADGTSGRIAISINGHQVVNQELLFFPTPPENPIPGTLNIRPGDNVDVTVTNLLDGFCLNVNTTIVVTGYDLNNVMVSMEGDSTMTDTVAWSFVAQPGVRYVIDGIAHCHGS